MNKKTILTSLMLAFTSLATASHGQSGGIFGLLSNLPFPLDNWRQMALSAATFGLIWFVVYMIVKKLIMKYDLEDLFNMGGSSSYGSSSGGRNLGAVMSLLIVVSMMGASHNYLGFTINTIQQLLLLAVGFGIVALAIAVIGGGTAGVLAVGGGTGKALGWGGKKAKEGLDKSGISSAAQQGFSAGKSFVGDVKNTLSKNSYVQQAGNKYASAANSMGFQVCSNCYKLNGQGAANCSDCKNSLP